MSKKPLPKITSSSSSSSSAPTKKTKGALKSVMVENVAKKDDNQSKLPLISTASSEKVGPLSRPVAEQAGCESSITSTTNEEANRLIAEENLRKEEAERHRQLEEAEEAARRQEMGNNGTVILIYEQYNEEFTISEGSTTHANIDDVYCLSYVMPECLIHLSKMNPQEKRAVEAASDNPLSVDIYLHENPVGTYHGLEKNNTYYVYVQQKADQLARDQERMRLVALTMEGTPSNAPPPLTRDDGRGYESCSCIYGNPCVDEYGCKDWSNRFAISSNNGWKGF